MTVNVMWKRKKKSNDPDFRQRGTPGSGCNQHHVR